MYVKELWRYPVKSMGGESLQTARLTEGGIHGDRIVQVRDARGHMLTARTYPDLLGLHARLGEDGAPLVDGVSWNDPGVLASVRKIVGAGGRLVHDERLDRFDVLPLLVATDGAIADFGRDSRRLRPNIVISGVPGETERTWEGGQLQIGETRIGIHNLRGRCNMTTFDPDTLAHDMNVLRDIVKRFAGKLALNCEVLEGGEIRIGEEVKFIPVDTARAWN